MNIDLDQKIYDPELVYLCNWLEQQLGITFTQTSGYRDGDSGVHGTVPCRGIDLRCRDELIGQAICDFVNRSWTYDPDRPEMKCAIYHNVGQGKHIHLQTHPHTVHG